MKEKNYTDCSLPVEKRVEDLLSRMSLMDKIGQMNQIWGLAQMKELGGPDPEEMARKGLAGSMLYVLDVETRNRFQRIAVEESPSGIPILYGSDVVHGYKTGFPIPLAMAASWEPELLRECQHIAAKEARADGIHWTFFPNADVARDARWGRIGETMGEDPFLASRLVAAQVEGFQGETLDADDSLLACVKHFAAYGACTGGRDYDQVIMSEAELRNVYFPPFQAGIDAGVGTLMTAYMDLNHVPATVNTFLLRDVLREEWKFDGFVVTDAGTIGSLITQGLAKDGADAAMRAVKAHVDMDMGSFQYVQFLAQLVAEGKVSMEEIDRAVRPILAAKFRLGLFEHPYVQVETQKEPRIVQDSSGAEELSGERAKGSGYREAALRAAEKSVILLKNDGNLLPLDKGIQKLAVIGPLADAPDDTEGILGMTNVPQAVTILEGIRHKLRDAEVLYAPGPWIKRTIPSMVSAFVPDFCGAGEKEKQTQAQAEEAMKAAIRTAEMADTVILVLGETRSMAGEAASCSDIGLPGRQEELLERVMALGKPTVLILMAGRPLAVNWAAEHVPAILEGFQLGWEAGNAVANILFGDVNPSAKLPVTIPRSAGQCPKYYAENLTHQPVEAQPAPYSRYWNEAGSPLYPFGYGLSYSTFRYDNLRLSAEEIKVGESVEAAVDITNTSNVDGEEIAQLYIHQRYGSDSRPKRLLKGFEKVSLAAGETKTVRFLLDQKTFTYYSTARKAYVLEPSEVDIWVGADVNARRHTVLHIAG